MNDLGERLSGIAFDDLKADYLLAMEEKHGNVVPVMLTKGEDMGNARLDVPYQLVTILSNIYPWLGNGKVAIVTRRCDEKALAELFKRGLFDPERVLSIGLACTKDQAAKCTCSDPVPSTVHLGEPQRPAEKDELSARLLAMSPEERLRFWIYQFKKCNKCFACTLNCPVCFCDECVLEERTFVPEPSIPPGMSFHLIRGYHLADKCIECGECERSCPAEIPLLTLRKMVARDVRELFGFVPGDRETVSPLLTVLQEGCDER